MQSLNKTEISRRNGCEKLQFQILVNQSGMIYSHYITSDIDILEAYKDALISKTGYVVWSNGVLDCNHIVGIIKGDAR